MSHTTFAPDGEWAAELTELQHRRAHALAMGGPEALAKFKASGRMNARERITQLLGPLLHGREPDLSEVAARLQLPSWTLRRKLAEEGTRFRDVLNETRRDLAETYIRDTELAFGEIAYLLGFASAEAFQRAFKRWTGLTPGEFRRSQRQAG